MSILVIVESPTKAKTIKQFLPKKYEITASMGHVRDLPRSATEIPAAFKKQPWSQIGVNYENDFAPLYVIPTDKKKTIAELKKKIKDADELILATDEDREGESISWHLVDILKPKIPVKRMVFHEITKEAIQNALKNFREIDQNLVRAQETRRILDRLVGYTISPLLWRKISVGLSAGRVQSVAVKLIVEKERERMAFINAGYWDIKASLSYKGSPFNARLTHVNDKKIASGKDFNENTGKLTHPEKIYLLEEKEARSLSDDLQNHKWIVKDIEKKKITRKPSPPFTTSSLQQEANRKLRLSSKETMMLAQNLYERGFITYMRTDSCQLSQQALSAARDCIKKKYGADYLPAKPRVYASKSKNAQEAHEAIRPAGTQFTDPTTAELSGNHQRLYELIWKRTVASQMAEALLTQVSMDINADNCLFRASGRQIDFPGFFRCHVEGSDNPEATLEDRDVFLPDMKKGDSTDCVQLNPTSHETQAPSRYTEASLVKKLETEGIGRPSTYSSIIGTIIERGYIHKQSEALIPGFTAFSVVALLEEHFANLIDTYFTANMEKILDHIAEGKAEWLPYLESFYIGKQGLSDLAKEKMESISPITYRQLKFANVEAKVCIGRYGAFLLLEQEEKNITASIPENIFPADITAEKANSILRQKKIGNEFGAHPITGEPIFLFTGYYGPYLQLGNAEEGKEKPKRVSFPKTIAQEDATLEMAVKLLELPKTLGQHPEKNGPIKVSIGRFGPYIVHENPETNTKDYRTLKNDDTPLNITFERALELLSQPKVGRGSRSLPLRELGNHPENGKPINILKGPYGNYVKNEKINASLPKGLAIEDVTLEKALELLAEKIKSPTKKTLRSSRRKK